MSDFSGMPSSATPSSLPIYGLMAEFDSPDALLDAARRAHREGYRDLEAYSPFPVEGLREALGRRRTWLPAVVFLAGGAGALVGYSMQYYMNVVDYPLNVGGRSMHSWPVFMVVTFQVTILFAALAAVFAMLILNGLPMPHHPIFNQPRFIRATRDRFFLCVPFVSCGHETGVPQTNPQFDPEATRAFLKGLEPLDVWDIPIEEEERNETSPE